MNTATRFWRGCARSKSVWIAALLCLALPAGAQSILSARLIEPTDRYGHFAMGPGRGEFAALRLGLSDGSARLIRLPDTRVFEDAEARLADVTGDGAAEVVVVESDLTQGARLSVWGADGLIAAGPFIGRRNRWMAVAGIADLDGDGWVEIATIDRPHLRKTLVIWRLQGDRLVAVAEAPGLTNHHLGAAAIEGGLRDCGQGPEVVVSDADWRGLVAVRFDGRQVALRALGLRADADGFAAALACRDGA